METLFSKIVGLAIIIAGLVGVWHMLSAYIKGGKLPQSEVKGFIFILLILGATPFLVDSVPKIGENLVKPVVSITEYVANTISTDLDSSIK